ncbi:MAG: hypothetical protein ACI90V_010236 [Bacillariaceae sp.]|jgi:hypothetical protein
MPPSLFVTEFPTKNNDDDEDDVVDELPSTS